MQNQPLTTEDSSTPTPSTESAVCVVESVDTPSAPEQQYRASAYSILAALLRSVPSSETLAKVSVFDQVEVDEDEMLLAMSSLGLAAQVVEADAIAEEYQNLFIGVGRGELMPYGSWYLTGYLMELPLSALRDDLAGLGFERDAAAAEPEDHIASLCEVMSILISDSASLETQIQFFEKHLGSWGEKFFQDLETAESASFYRSVGRFGSAFISLDKQYLNMPV